MNSRGASRGGSASRSPSRGGGSKRGGSRGGNKGKAKKAADDGEMGTYSERTIWSQRFKGWKRYEVKKPRVVREEDRTKNWIQTFHGRPTTFGGLIGNHLDSVQRTLQTFVDQVSIYRGWLLLYSAGAYVMQSGALDSSDLIFFYHILMTLAWHMTNILISTLFYKHTPLYLYLYVGSV